MSLHNQYNSNMKSILYHDEKTEYTSNFYNQTTPPTYKGGAKVPSYSEEQKKEDEKVKKAFKFLFYIHYLKYFKFQIFLNSNFLTTNSSN